jgi:FkbM family methyltransferase
MELHWLSERSAEARELYNEVIVTNCYGLTEEICKDREFIDIGANMGMFSIFASSLGASKVIAIEPVSSTVDILKDNIEQSKLNITVLQNIVSDTGGEMVKIGLQPKSGHNSVYSPSVSFEEVKTITLKDLLDMTISDNVFLKIDCEGGEYDILLNADNLDRVTTVAIEIHADLHPNFHGAWHIHEALTKFGFKPIVQNQMKSWRYDAFGQPFDIKNLPVSEEIWVRHG